MHFGPTLKLLRIDAGFTLRALARRIGVSSAYLSRVENGRDPVPTPERLSAIADALELPPDTLFELARQTGPALADYLRRVPAAGGFFLDVARRDLDASQLARLRELIDAEFPSPNSHEDGTSLSTLIDQRIMLDVSCTSMSQVVNTAAELCVGPEQAEHVAQQVLERERASTTAIGRGVAIPHALIPGIRRRAALITMAKPLDVIGPDEIPVEVAIVVIGGDGGREHLELLALMARLAGQDLASELRHVRHPRDARAVIERLQTQ